MLQDTFYDFSTLAQMYEDNGILAKIVDMPAEDAAGTGFDLVGISPAAADFFTLELDRLAWEDAAADALRWQRLFFGSIIVPVVDDGQRLTDPLDPDRVRRVDSLHVFSAACARPNIDSQTGAAESFTVQTPGSSFTVHSSRCLLFKSDPAPPEQAADDVTAFWGVGMFYRIKAALHDAALSSGAPARILSTMGQNVLKVENLSGILSTAEGSAALADRLALMDAVRGLCGTLMIDMSETYQTAPTPPALTETAGIINSVWTALASVSGIPARVLAGGVVLDSGSAIRAPFKKGADLSSQEQYQDLVRRVQVLTLKKPLLRLLHILTRAGLHAGQLSRAEPLHIRFRPLYPPSPMEQAKNELKAAETELTRVRTLQTFVEQGALDRREVLALLKKQRSNLI